MEKASHGQRAKAQTRPAELSDKVGGKADGSERSGLGGRFGFSFFVLDLILTKMITTTKPTYFCFKRTNPTQESTFGFLETARGVWKFNLFSLLRLGHTGFEPGMTLRGWMQCLYSSAIDCPMVTFWMFWDCLVVEWDGRDILPKVLYKTKEIRSIYVPWFSFVDALKGRSGWCS